MTLRDPVPLGVSGSVTMPLEQYVARVGREPGPPAVLLEERERIAYVAHRLSEALDRPFTNPGSEGWAREVLQSYQETDLLPTFAESAMETLRDQATHSATAISTEDIRVAVMFVAWSGTYREVQPQRFGDYLPHLFATGRLLVEQGILLAGLLEIDAYVRENPNVNDPTRPLQEVFEVDVEYSFLPGGVLGSPDEGATSLPALIMLNPDLCSPEQLQHLRALMARRS
jgi:hypothetical protein